MQNYKYNKTITIADAIKQALDELNATDKVQQAKLRKYWDKIVGKYAADQTLEILFMNKILYVKVKSAALRNELHMARTYLQQKIWDSFEIKVEKIIVY